MCQPYFVLVDLWRVALTAGHQATLSSLFEAVGTYQAGDMGMDELDFLEKKCLPNLWLLFRYVYCQFHELFDGSIRSCSSWKWYHPSCFRWTSGIGSPRTKQLVENIKRISAHVISWPKRPWWCLCARYKAMGGSTNTVLHTLATREAGIDLWSQRYQRG